MNGGVPVPRWNRPRRKVLEGKHYPAEKPPFDPFPTVSHIVNAGECSMLALHNLLRGLDNLAHRDREWAAGRVGSLYHQFISSVKSKVLSGELEPDSKKIMWELMTTPKITPKRKKALRQCVRPWVIRKIDELDNLQENIFYEITVANDYVEFMTNDGTITYPFQGRIDELDIDNERLVERTIRPSEDGKPPLGKDFQAWLLWKILCSVDAADLPEFWQEVNFDDFKIVVETPEEDFEVEKKNKDFERKANEAFAWVHDLYADRRAEGEAWRDKACTYGNRRKGCGSEWYCYGKIYRYPRARPQMRREFREIYRALFYETMWDKHLFYYQLLMLEPSKLEELGLVSSARVRSFRDDKLEVEVDKAQASPIRSHAKSTDFSSYNVVLGNFSLGLRLQAELEDSENNRLVFKVKQMPHPPTSVAKIMPSETSIFSSKPWFLKRNIQRNMYRLQRKWGKSKKEKAEEDSLVQLVEGIFGTIPLRSGGNHG